MEGFKSLINYISNPTILFTAILVGFPFVFPPNDWFYNINKKLKIDKLWTKKGLFVMVAVTIVFFVFGLGDSDFRSIVFCLLYTSPSPRDGTKSRMPSSA